MAPKVSILIPAYNVEPYIRQCLDSVCNQTLKEIEIIIVNDGSKDNTLSIITEYAAKDKRIIVIDKENGGYGKAMNVAASHASGDYIGIVEPDDCVAINMFETLYDKAKENDLDFIKADFYRFAKDQYSGNVLYVLNRLTGDKEKYNRIFNPSQKLESLRWVMNTWSGIYKRTFIEENHISYNETPGASFQDNGFWFQTFVFGKKAMILDVPLYRNRRDNPNSSVKDKTKVYSMNVEYAHIRTILEKDPELWNRVKGYFWLKKWDNYSATLNRIDKSARLEYIKSISEEFNQGIKNNEVDFNLFNDFQHNRLKKLTSNCDEFYNDFEKNNRVINPFDIQEKVIKLEKELKRIKNSESYKVGLFITKIPRKIKSLIKRWGKK